MNKSIYFILPLIVVVGLFSVLNSYQSVSAQTVNYSTINSSSTGLENYSAVSPSSMNAENLILNIKFDSIKINKDHDPFNRGDWDLVGYVNNNKIPLLDRAKVVEGDTYDFRTIDSNDSPNVLLEDKEITIQIPKQDKLSIQVFGVERDGGSGSLPDIDSPGFVGDSYWVLKTTLEQFLAINSDDGLGMIADTYDSTNNFGIGTHTANSIFNGINNDSTGDYTITYTISKINQ